uniref:Ribonuclease P n=1 Tax=Panagrolaimus superbus TaxID=310955 RepID=A0A914YQW9_9BILA
MHPEMKARLKALKEKGRKKCQLAATYRPTFFKCIYSIQFNCVTFVLGITFTKTKRVHHHHIKCLTVKLSAIFNLQSLIIVLLLFICTCAYTRAIVPKIVDRQKIGIAGIFWKCARIGERLSIWVALGKTAFVVQINLLKKLLETKTDCIRLHAVGQSIPRAVALADTLNSCMGNTIKISAGTTTMMALEEFDSHPVERSLSKIIIRVTRIITA